MSRSDHAGARIRTLREQRGLTQSAVAAAIGISRPHLTKIEMGGDRPGRDVLMAAAVFFNTSLDWLTASEFEEPRSVAEGDLEVRLLTLFRNLPEEEGAALVDYIEKRSASSLSTGPAGVDANPDHSRKRRAEQRTRN